mmetsp:Transcript_49413/g.97656  ORF Transcript_49413/g.97656 Transcript_49413/m.97656 type:complete len:214 (-) Transcript_49413:680-1321(-)
MSTAAPQAAHISGLASAASGDAEDRDAAGGSVSHLSPAAPPVAPPASRWPCPPVDLFRKFWRSSAQFSSKAVDPASRSPTPPQRRGLPSSWFGPRSTARSPSLMMSVPPFRNTATPPSSLLSANTSAVAAASARDAHANPPPPETRGGSKLGSLAAAAATALASALFCCCLCCWAPRPLVGVSLLPASSTRLFSSPLHASSDRSAGKTAVRRR